jgi:acetyltransferase-like isoleucine patch superfamily enzyme
MKNPLAHINITAPFNIIRSIIFHFSPFVKKYSVSSDYLHLCAYVNVNCFFEISKGATVEFYDNGFLALGTERSSFRGWAGRTKIHMLENSKLVLHGMNQIGRGSLVWILADGVIDIAGGGFTAGNNIIIAKERVSIGKNCQIAWGVTISDHDFHRTFTNGVKNTETAPVKIGDGVWIGMNATILKGVEIGDSAIVAAGSLVTQNVPARSMVAGVPARVIKENVEFYG